MIETEVLNVLTAALAPVPVSMEVPSPMPGTFVVLEKTGTSRTDQITTSTFAVQSWAPTMLDATQLNEQAKAAMDALPARQGIGSARLENDYNFTDTATHRYRYQAVYRVVHGTI